MRETGLLGVRCRTQTRYLLTGILTCPDCGANFIARVAHRKRFGTYHYYGCAHHARRGDAVCPSRTLLPQAEVERELLDILQQELLTPDTLERLLKVVNAKLRAQAAASRPRVAEVRKALAHVERQINNYTRAIARGDFASLESALGAAEQRRATLQAELAHLDGKQQTAIIQLTPAALEHRLHGMTEKLRSGVKGKVREAIEQSVGRILVAVDGSLMIKAKPSGLLGLEGNAAHLSAQERQGVLEHGFVSRAGRQWTVTTEGQAVGGVAHA